VPPASSADGPAYGRASGSKGSAASSHDPRNVRFLFEGDGALTVRLPPDLVIAAKIEPAVIAA